MRSWWTACPTSIRSFNRSATFFCTSSNGLASGTKLFNAFPGRQKAVHTVYHIFRPDTAPLCPVVHDPLPLADECIQQDVPIVVDDADAGERGLASFRAYTDHLAVHRDIFPWSTTETEGVIQ